MASALLENLSAASTLAASDLFYVKQAGARGLKATGTQLLALVGTTYVPLTGGTMTGALTIASGTLTASAPALNVTQTWNGAGVTFFGLDLSFTNTAIADAYPINVKVGGSSIFYLRYNGAANFVQNVSALNFLSTSGAIAFGENYGIRGGSATSFSWTSATATSGTADLFIVRDAAATLAQRNGTTQQIFRLYNTADAGLANYERLTLTGVAGTSVNITAETMGTGADNLDIVLTPAGTGSVKIPVAGLALSGVDANFLLGTTGTSRLTFAGTFSVINKSASADLCFGESTDTGAYFFRGTGGVNVTGAFQVTEMTAPAAPSTNSVRIYAEDNGAGKTRLMALFATGAAQQISIEP